MKYVIKFGRETYPISEDEIPKVIRAMDEKMIVVLKSGVFSGAFISAIVKDIHGEKGWNYGYIPQGGDNLSRADYITTISDVLRSSETTKKLIQ